MGRRAELSLLPGLAWPPVDLTVVGWQDLWRAEALGWRVSRTGAQAEGGHGMGVPPRLHGRMEGWPAPSPPATEQVYCLDHHNTMSKWTVVSKEEVMRMGVG